MRAIRLGRSSARTSGALAFSFLILAAMTALAAGPDKPKEIKKADVAVAKPENPRTKTTAKEAKAKPDVSTAEEPATEEAKGPKSKVEVIDELLQAAWEAGGVKPSKRSDDAEFLRRAYLDLAGRIPTVKEAVEFLTIKDPGKRLKLVDSLLASPDFARNFGTEWTILLIGRKRQERIVNRDALTAWLRQQFANNRPWNEMAYELLTAKGSNRENGAANFVMAHLEFERVPLTSISMRVFLGQQIQCTQCHDHPSNDWKQVDFWSINAFFKGVRTREVMKVGPAGEEVLDYTELFDEPTDAFSTFERRNAMVGIAFPTFLDGRKISQGPDVDRREALGKFVTVDNAQFARAFVNRIWGHLMGRGFVFPTDDFGAHNPPSNPELLEQLATDFKASKYDVKALIREICACQAYNATSSTTKDNDKDEVLFSHMLLKPMSPEQLFDSLLTATSAHKAGGVGNTDRMRADWMGQFQFAFANDEGEESTSFQGTIPQALMMMNGPLMEKAVSGEPGSFLNDVLIQAQLQRRQPIDLYIIRRLYLAALSREPSTRELARAREFLRRDLEHPIPVMEDVFWALLNSNEFILNR